MAKLFDGEVGDFSVLMSVYIKTEACFLDQALRSIWDDQILKPDEVVIVRDGPVTRDVEVILKSWTEKLKGRLIVILLAENKGLGNALNEGIKRCSHELIARMDDDDISLGSRFFRQYNFMSINPDVVALGTQVEERSNDLKEVLSYKKLPTVTEELKKFARYRCPLNHPTVMYRKTPILDVGGYPKIFPEDFPLWSVLLSNGYKIANLPQVLLIMRQEEAYKSRRGMKFLFGEIRMFNFMRRIGFIGNVRFAQNCLIRVLIRLSPQVVKFYLFKLLK